MGTEHEAAAKAMVDKVMALLARARAADAAARDAKALLAGAVRRILAADSGPEEWERWVKNLDATLEAIESAEPLASVTHRDFKPANIPAPRVIAEAIFDHIDMHGWEGSGHDKPFAERAAASMAGDAMRAGRERVVGELAAVIEGATEPLGSPLPYIKRALDEWCGEHRDACPAGKSWLEEIVITLESPGDLPRITSRCLGLLRQAEALWPAEAERLSMDLPTTGSGMLADLIDVLERCSPAPAHPWPLWCVFETDPNVERPFHGPFTAFVDADDTSAGLRDEGREVAVRRCRRIRATECMHADWQVEGIVDAIQDDPGHKVTDPGVYVLGGFDVPWARVRKGADLRVLDDVIEVDAFEVEPEGATS